MAANPDDADDEDEWRFSLSDLDGEDEQTVEGEEDGETEGSGEGIAGSLDIGEEIEAGDIDLENAVFVVVGVLLAIAFILGFLTLL